MGASRKTRDRRHRAETRPPPPPAREAHQKLGRRRATSETGQESALDQTGGAGGRPSREVPWSTSLVNHLRIRDDRDAESAKRWRAPRPRGGVNDVGRSAATPAAVDNRSVQHAPGQVVAAAPAGRASDRGDLWHVGRPGYVTTRTCAPWRRANLFEDSHVAAAIAEEQRQRHHQDAQGAPLVSVSAPSAPRRRSASIHSPCRPLRMTRPRARSAREQEQDDPSSSHRPGRDAP
jgi:hypothetical protein